MGRATPAGMERDLDLARSGHAVLVGAYLLVGTLAGIVLGHRPTGGTDFRLASLALTLHRREHDRPRICEWDIGDCDFLSSLVEWKDRLSFVFGTSGV